MTTADNIRKLRVQHGYTQEELAKITGIGEKYISALEAGRRRPGDKVKKALCDVFMVSEQALLYGDDEGLSVKEHHSFAVRTAIDVLTPLSASEQHRLLAILLREIELKQQS